MSEWTFCEHKAYLAHVINFVCGRYVLPLGDVLAFLFNRASLPIFYENELCLHILSKRQYLNAG